MIYDKTQKTIEQCTNRSFRTVPATYGTSNARRMKPDLKLNGLGAHNSAISVQNIHSYLEKKNYLKYNLLIDMVNYLLEEEEQHIHAIQIPRHRLATNLV